MKYIFHILLLLGTNLPSFSEVTLPRYYGTNPSQLARTKSRLAAGDVALKSAFKGLMSDAEMALNRVPPSVTDKPKLPPSGDKNDYMTTAPYFWPDPAKKDGLPYIRHDGKVNPECSGPLYDHERVGDMASSVQSLALAYYFTGKEVYAEKAAKYLKVWFLDPNTRMNPNLNYAQAIPGKNTGRGTGIIEGRNLTQAADAAGLLEGSQAWNRQDNEGLKRWLSGFLDWMLNSENGREEASAKNNHGTYYDSQVISLALMLDRKDLAKQFVMEAREKRIGIQIAADGSQPLELTRETSLGYSLFNLEALFELATLADYVGVDLWNYQTPDGRGIEKALDYLLPYVVPPVQKWPYKQIKPLKQSNMAPLLLQAISVYRDPKYEKALSDYGKISGKRIQLLYPSGISATDVAAIDRGRILKAADAALRIDPLSITKYKSPLSDGGPNDFYSNGDYWWPDPSKPNGLPYIQRDGQTNPENFDQHRMMVRQLRDAVAALAAAYKITNDEQFSLKASELLRVFFIDPATRMAPHLKYAQAIPGVSPGRGIGIIDTLHLIEVPTSIETFRKSKSFSPELNAGLKQWFAEYLDWMTTSKNGHDEATTKNNHAVAFWLQAAVFAHYTANEGILAECRRQYKEVLVPRQMAADGSFPAELARTKPYAYSIFQLDNMTTLCQVLSSSEDDLWNFTLPDGRGIRKAAAYLFPFLSDKSKWPLKPDVQAWAGWPARQTSLIFAGTALRESHYIDLWENLPADPTDPEVQRNIAITQPLLWMN